MNKQIGNFLVLFGFLFFGYSQSQLQIENKQFIIQIDERNNDLLKLKMTTGNTVQLLNNLK